MPVPPLNNWLSNKVTDSNVDVEQDNPGLIVGLANNEEAVLAEKSRVTRPHVHDAVQPRVDL